MFSRISRQSRISFASRASSFGGTAAPDGGGLREERAADVGVGRRAADLGGLVDERRSAEERQPRAMLAERGDRGRGHPAGASRDDEHGARADAARARRRRAGTRRGDGARWRGRRPGRGRPPRRGPRGEAPRRRDRRRRRARRPCTPRRSPSPPRRATRLPPSSRGPRARRSTRARLRDRDAPKSPPVSCRVTRTRPPGRTAREDPRGCERGALDVDGVVLRSRARGGPSRR